MKSLYRIAHILTACALVATAALADDDLSRQWELFRQLQPTLTIEITEANINTFLRDHAGDIGLSGGYSNPRVAFEGGDIEVSAAKRLGFFSTRLKVGMEPDIENGRLVLRERKTGVGGISLPISFHTGVADTIMGTINGALERNDMILRRVEIVNGRVRAIADIRPKRIQPVNVQLPEN
jgi:hypothetical protein